MSIYIPENKSMETASKKLPCVLLLDCSGSMADDINKMRTGVEAFRNALLRDDLAASTVEVSMITFADDAKVVEPFGPAFRMEIPYLAANGMTAMHEAVELGLASIKKRRKEYYDCHISAYKPWMFIFTDGASNDDDNGAFDTLYREVRAGKINAYGVAVGDGVDEDTLSSFRPDSQYLKVDRMDNISSCFKWIFDSFSSITQVDPGTVLALPSPNSPEYRGVEVCQMNTVV